MKAVLFADTETSGKYNFKLNPEDPSQPDLVQLAAVLATRERILAQINFIIRPEGWTITDEVAAIHGISIDTANKYGVARRIALANFNQLSRLASRLVAHNLNFDYSVMRTNFYRERKPHCMDPLEQICTMRAATSVLKLPKPFVSRYSNGDQWKWPTLTEMYGHFIGGTFDGAHNAMKDVEAMMACYWKLEEQGHIRAL